MGCNHTRQHPPHNNITTRAQKSLPGANFGGTCVDAACASKREAGGLIAANLGMLTTNPFACETKCPCCGKEFRASRVWFYQCHVVLRKVAPNPDAAIDVRGADMRVVELTHEGAPECTSFTTSP